MPEPITAKQVAVLKRLAKLSPMVASWKHAELSPLQSMGFVQRASAYQASGRLSQAAIWTITEQGRRFLEEERAGC